MAQQNYSNHSQTVPVFHFVLMPVLLLTVIGSIVNVYHSVGNHDRIYSASLILVLSMCVLLGVLFGRMFALKAQDRAIRAEENLRHYALTGKLLDARLSVRQIIGLRFAPDSEFAALAAKAAAGGMTEDAIKKAVQNWREDTYRV
jgi:L-cystine uptake protein TcyP (sodium:dicarboxylate symporter family)